MYSIRSDPFAGFYSAVNYILRAKASLLPQPYLSRTTLIISSNLNLSTRINIIYMTIVRENAENAWVITQLLICPRLILTFMLTDNGVYTKDNVINITRFITGCECFVRACENQI